VTAPQTVAIVLAGGEGSRVGADRPKQLLRVSGKTLLEHSVAAFEASPGVDEIVVMMTPDLVLDAEEIVARAGFEKVRMVAAGGATRRQTTYAALRLVPRSVRNVLVHDAARPLVSQQIVQRCLAALEEHQAVSVAVAPSDTVYRVSPEGDILHEVLRRSDIRLAQTPQAFRLELILAAHERADAEGHDMSTDDCGIVARYFPDVPIRVVEGDPRNLKVTVASDLLVAEVLESPTEL